MKLSIITINYNDCAGLDKTINSVLSQTWKEFEYIVIDGGSTDGSKELIEKNNSKIDYWVSEPDKGIYNAMNKGIVKAKGDYLLFLNSGDWLCDDILQTIQHEFIDESNMVLYGNVIVENGDGTTRLWEPKERLDLDFFCLYMIPHQASFIKRTLFFEDGKNGYNEDLKIASDWEFFFEKIVIKGVASKYLPYTIAHYNYEGISSQPEGIAAWLKERESIIDKYYPKYFELYVRYRKLCDENARNLARLNSRVVKFYFKLRGIKY